MVLPQHSFQSRTVDNQALSLVITHSIHSTQCINRCSLMPGESMGSKSTKCKPPASFLAGLNFLEELVLHPALRSLKAFPW